MWKRTSRNLYEGLWNFWLSANQHICKMSSMRPEKKSPLVSYHLKNSQSSLSLLSGNTPMDAEVGFVTDWSEGE